MQNLEEVLLKKDKNNFNLLRFMAASGVVITHSYALLGFPESDLLSKNTNGLLSFSRLGVYVFFVISGFLIANSLWNSQNLKSFFWKRFLRIFPALAAMLFLETFIVVPFITKSSLIEYFSSLGTYHYFLGGLSLYDTQYSLSGVFKANPHTGVNGSLWTLPYEWTCYVLLACLVVPLKKKRIFGTLVTMSLLMMVRVLVGRYQIFQVVSFLKLDSRQFLLFGFLFFSGVLCLELRQYLKFRPLVAVLLVLGLHYFSYVSRGASFYFMLLIVPYLSISLASAKIPKKITDWFSKVDYSYGLYIYAYFVGQIFVNFFREYLSVAYLAVLTMLFTLPLAVISWHFIEKPALKLKKVI